MPLQCMTTSKIECERSITGAVGPSPSAGPSAMRGDRRRGRGRDSGGVGALLPGDAESLEHFRFAAAYRLTDRRGGNVAVDAHGDTEELPRPPTQNGCAGDWRSSSLTCVSCLNAVAEMAAGSLRANRSRELIAQIIHGLGEQKRNRRTFISAACQLSGHSPGLADEPVAHKANLDELPRDAKIACKSRQELIHGPKPTINDPEMVSADRTCCCDALNASR